MKKVYLLLTVFAIQFAFAQDSQMFYEGYFYVSNSKAQKNLLVTNKTSGNYDFTDDKGYLVIEAKAGDTLVYNKKDFRIIQTYDLKEMKAILDSKYKSETANPILSNDYLASINSKKNDSAGFIKSKVRAKKIGGNSEIFQYIKKSDSGYVIKKQTSKNILYSGSLQVSTEFGSANIHPKLQNQFVQGRNANGALQWNGPETAEMFSFGPQISTLGFDGNPYEYDVNGRLVAKSKSISPANAYNNSILQKTQKSSTFFSINSYYEKDKSRKWNAGLDLGWVREDLLIKDQFQDTKNLGISLGKNIFKNHKLSFNYKFNEQKATNTNRIGLFNRAYQNSLLTPISFENKQGNLLSAVQRSYSSLADNPDYLLDNSRKYNFNQNQNIFNVKLSKETGRWQYFVGQSYENTKFSNFDYYKIFTSGFQNGIETERNQNIKNYNVNLGGSYSLRDSYYDNNKLYFNAILNQNDTRISYTNFQNYNYNRFSQDYILRYKFNFSDVLFNDFNLDGEVGNGIYTSNTTTKSDFFIPKLALSLEIKDLIDYDLKAKIFGSIYKNVYESDFNKSYSNFLLTQIDNDQFNTYFPVQEVASFKGLQSINNLETKFGLRLSYRYGHNLEGSFTNKKYANDVFPVFENGKIMLKNLVDHNSKSYDLNLNLNNFPFRYGNLQIGFNKTTSKVTNVLGDYENAPISGFNSVYRGIVKGEALGVLIGNAYQRNENGNVIIGNDGFPLVSAEKKVLGNPIPDFIMKFSYTQNVWDFSLNVDLEWRKGGDIWNGTNANLDYYGRSENSASQRSISNFIFDGVLQNGNVNNIPVDFFNIDEPFEQNKFYRYGSLGVAEDYIVKGDAVRINNITLSYNLRKTELLKNVKISVFAKNILLWSKNKIDEQTSFFDSDNGQGLNFYNLPSMRSYGATISFIF
ncbi:MAG: hypothetical protein J6O88_17840 [Chryseobacterium sp.]|uniref:hypothetical protein n=1 Tax=Chryseobacterium sp. TaxID=1871047 RepID=UPI001B1BB94A|nr:hypothetical protein [Chryseobacterium sp.]MBO6186522.1 hypothetical protein [Chryseobacterium sp.]